jgi:hypothetical protein
MALAKGESKIKVGTLTEHTKAGLYIISKFVSGVDIQIEKLETSNLIKIKGILTFEN